MYIFNKSSIGYNHILNNKVCQDFSASYHDEERTIITCCDGHGGNIYIRSNLGSKFASEAIMKVFKNITKYDTRKFSQEDYLKSIKLQILCEWNNLVENHLSKHKIQEKEISFLTENERYKLFDNKAKAYGSTMLGCLLINNKLLIVQLGDGEIFLLKNKNINSPFAEEEDEPVGNITYSLCEEDAFSHIKIICHDFRKWDGILLCTDGLINPYLSYKNFEASFAYPLFKELEKNGNLSIISIFVNNMAQRLGIGDDVSLSFIYKNKAETKLNDSIIKEKLKIPYHELYEAIYKK